MPEKIFGIEDKNFPNLREVYTLSTSVYIQFFDKADALQKQYKINPQPKKKQFK